MANDRGADSQPSTSTDMDTTEPSLNVGGNNSARNSCSSPSSSPSSSVGGATDSQQHGQHQQQQHQRKEESIFSFKHFLKSTAESSSAAANNRIDSIRSSIAVTTAAINTTMTSASTVTSSSNGQHLGARPKVPQYNLNGVDSSHQNLSRMKRSPKFPSFDSHASLAEFSDLEVSPNFVQRSHSNYEVETPAKTTSTSEVNAVQPDNSRNNNDFSSALPDFVKDHFIFEQWYQSNPASVARNGAGPARDDHHLPSQLPDKQSGTGDDLPFDLMSMYRRRNNSPTAPLDLPSYDSLSGMGGSSNQDRMQLLLDLPHARGSASRNAQSDAQSGRLDLPFDLTSRLVRPINERRRNDSVGDLGEERATARSASPRPMQQQPLPQADMIQTLPDFLSDGPIHSSGRLADVAQDLPHLDSPEENSNNIISRLRLENDRLRHELDDARRQLSEKQQQLTETERACRTSEIQRNGILLEKNKLQQRVTQMVDELEALKKTGVMLPDEEDGAVGGNDNDLNRRSNQGIRPYRAQQLSRELTQAAANAETNLRQLLAGVNNLRLMATKLENIDHIENPLDYMSDCDDEDYPGGQSL